MYITFSHIIKNYFSRWNDCRIIWFYLGTVGIIRGYYELCIVKKLAALEDLFSVP
jgi:hypothetical protein